MGPYLNPLSAKQFNFRKLKISIVPGKIPFKYSRRCDLFKHRTTLNSYDSIAKAEMFRRIFIPGTFTYFNFVTTHRRERSFGGFRPIKPGKN